MNRTGSPSCRDLVHGAHRHPESVRVLQPLVDPRPVGQAVRVELAARQHDLPVLAVDEVAVVVDRGEVVVGADFLELSERVEQGLVVPEPHVVDGVPVVLDVGQRKGGVARHLPLLDVVEPERLPRGRDVVGQVGGFPLLFVRGDDEALQGDGTEVPAHRDQRVEPDGGHQGPVPRGQGGDGAEGGADERDEHQRPEDRHPQHHVDVRGAVDGPGRGREDPRDVQVRAPREQEEDARDEQPQVAPRAVADDRPPRGVDAQLVRDDVEGGRPEQREHHHREGEIADEVDEGEGEYVEADVAAEQRIRLVERHRVLELQPREPLVRGERAEEQRHEGRDPHAQPLQLPRGQHHRLDVAVPREQRVGLGEAPEGEAEVQGQPRERQQEHHRAQRHLGAEGVHEDAGVLDLVEPEPLGEEVQRRRHDHERRQENQQKNESRRHGSSLWRPVAATDLPQH